MRLFEKIARLRFRSLNRGEQTDAVERPVENTDAFAATGGELQSGFGSGHNSIPPAYVKAYDEGRPRH
jgi:hypothetical protein